jgi:hypothetical protein
MTGPGWRRRMKKACLIVMSAVFAGAATAMKRKTGRLFLPCVFVAMVPAFR